MNGKDLLIAMGDISPKYYQEAEFETMAFSRKGIRRPLLIAALIAMMLLLVGCAVAYALSMQDIKIGEHSIMQTQGDSTDETEIQLDVLSLQGVKDSPNYLAN